MFCSSFFFILLFSVYARQATTRQLQGRLLLTPYKNYKTERMFKIYRLTSLFIHVCLRNVGATASLLRPSIRDASGIKNRGRDLDPSTRHRWNTIVRLLRLGTTRVFARFQAASNYIV